MKISLLTIYWNISQQRAEIIVLLITLWILKSKMYRDKENIEHIILK